MEFLGLPKPSQASSLSGVPGLSTSDLEPDLDLDDDKVVIGIRPKSSPMPRRKSFSDEEDLEPGPPPSGSRRVSFADSLGLTLVQVKEFDTWDVPKLPAYEFSENKAKKDTKEYSLSPLNFSHPLSAEELLIRIKKQKVELDTIEILPETTTLRGVICVLNMSFSKAVYVRTTLDTWSSHFDLLAEYMPGHSDSQTDRFSFKLTLVPPFGPQGARVDFCLRYETPVGTFWANNNNANYVLFCRQQVKEIKEIPRRDSLSKKSCLKTSSPTSSPAGEINSTEKKSCQDNQSTDPSRHEVKVGAIDALPVSKKEPERSPAGSEELKAENRQNSSKRNRRRAARMARIEDLFAQRDKDGSAAPPEANEAMRDKPRDENWSEAQSLLEGSSICEGSPHNMNESMGTCQTATQSSSSSNVEPEMVHLTETDGLHGGEDVLRLQNNWLDLKDGRAPAECLGISQSASTSESMMTERVTSGMSNETTFETALAPLYQQAFGGVGGASHNASLCGDPADATIKTSHLLQSCIHADKGEVNCSIVNEDEVNGNTQKCPHTPLIGPFEEEEAGLSQTKQGSNAEKWSDRESTSTDVVPQTILRQLHTVKRFGAHLENPQISTEGRRLQGGEQEGNATHSAQKQTATEKTAAEAPTLIKICPQAVETDGVGEVVPDCDTSLPQKEAERVGDEARPRVSSDDFTGVKPALHLPQQQTHGGEDKEDTRGYAAVQSEKENSPHCDFAHRGSECFSDSVGVKNWETMVKEEEENILMEGNESQASDLGVEETEAAVRPEDSGTRTAITTENKWDESGSMDEPAVTAATEAVGKTRNLSAAKLFWPAQENGQKLEEIKKQEAHFGMAETDRGEKSEEEKNANQEVNIKVDTAVVHQIKQIRSEKVLKGEKEEEQQQQQKEKETEGAMLTYESRPAVQELHQQPEEENTTKQEGATEEDLSVVHMAKEILPPPPPQEEEEAQEEEEEEMEVNIESKSAVEEQLDEVCVGEVAHKNITGAQSGFQGDSETSWDCRNQPTERPERAADRKSSKQVFLTNGFAAPLLVDADLSCFKENFAITPTEGPGDQSDGREGDRVSGEIQEEAPQNSQDLLQGHGDPTADEEEQEEVEKKEEEEQEEAPQNPEDLPGLSGDPPLARDEVQGVEKKEEPEEDKQEEEAPNNPSGLMEGVGDPPAAEEEGEKEAGKKGAPHAAEEVAVGVEKKEEEKHEDDAPHNLGDVLEGRRNSPASKEEEEEREKRAPQEPGDLLEDPGDPPVAEEQEEDVNEEEKELEDQGEEQKGEEEEEVVKEEEEESESFPWAGERPGSVESSESDSEDEVELYMHCLRAVHAGEQAQRDQSKGAGLGLGGGGAKVLAFSRCKRPPATHMPSISESLDEEQPPVWLQDQEHKGHQGHEGHGGMCDVPTAAPDSSDLMGQKNISREVSCWKDKFTKTLLSATLFVVFILVAYHYDFLACFGLYVISVIWLCCRGDSQTVKNDRKG